MKLFVVVAILGALTATPALAVAFPSLALHLGLAKAKALKLEGNDAARFLCSDEGIAAPYDTTTLDKAAGEGRDVVCAWYEPEGSDWLPVADKVAGVTVSSSFFFYPPADGAEPMLSRVFAAGSPDDHQAVFDAVTALYGAANRHSDATHDAAGVLTDGVADSWILEGVEVTLDQNFFALGKLILSYSDPELEFRAGNDFSR